MSGDVNLAMQLDIAEPVVATITRELGPEDIQVLAIYGARGFEQPALVRIRSRHHQVARLLAQGETTGTVAAICGMTAANIHILRRDPTFRELVTFYEGEIKDRYLAMHEEIAGLGLDAIHELKDRLESNPDDIETADLIRIMEKALDRSGHGPASRKDVNVTVGLADRLSAARERLLRANVDTLIEDATIVEKEKD